MFKKLFFAVNLPIVVKKELLSIRKELEDDLAKGIKWVEEENLHITLLFLGNTKEDKVDDIISATEEIKQDFFKVFFSKLTYMPPEKEKARMIWVTGESEELVVLQKKIERCMVPSFKREKDKDFLPHITLGRIKSWEFRKRPLYKIPEVEREISINFKPSSFELMESKQGKRGPVYKKIASFSFQE